MQVSPTDRKAYYDGFSNRTLWPLYHDALRKPEFEDDWWDVYREVNERFAQRVAELASASAMVWVHDYHLHLVPARLRTLRPDLRIGFFLHVPFPPPEIFSRLPWAREILEGTLGADLIGFHTEDYVANFRRAAAARAPSSAPHRRSDRSPSKIAAYPISVDVPNLRRIAAWPSVRAAATEIRRQLGDRQILLGVDRLDYTKGILDRLETFRDMLRDGQLEPDRCALVQIAVPSREDVPDYREHRQQIERLVGQINGEFGTVGHQPVHYLYRSYAMRRLMTYYLAADVMLVTPLRDGMNLVAKEFAISQGHGGRGRLVLSRFAGAAAELTDALLVNPFDRTELGDTILAALDMSRVEAERRANGLAHVVDRWDVRRWADRFVADLAGRSPPSAERHDAEQESRNVLGTAEGERPSTPQIRSKAARSTDANSFDPSTIHARSTSLQTPPRDIAHEHLRTHQG